MSGGLSSLALYCPGPAYISDGVNLGPVAVCVIQINSIIPLLAMPIYMALNITIMESLTI